jgi:hypothetical protein
LFLRVIIEVFREEYRDGKKRRSHLDPRISDLQGPKAMILTVPSSSVLRISSMTSYPGFFSSMSR